MLRKVTALLLLTLLPTMLWAFPDDCVWDAEIFVDQAWMDAECTTGGGHVYFTQNNLYVLDHLVFVKAGCELHVEPGTVIQALPGEAEESSALVVARDGKIWADGTEDAPIIFTAYGDDMCDPFDMAYDQKGLWGGVILLGRATINTDAKVGNIEGIDPLIELGRYGDSTGFDDDNSGILRYVSIRHGGTEIGEANEINGLTMGGVGSGTIIDYVEVYSNKDDGFEWFGGTVNMKHIVAINCGDDCFDYDEGYRGKGQFWYAQYDSLVGDKNGEHDGGTTPEDGLPYAIPEIYNATYVGVGALEGHAVGVNSKTFNIRDNAGGHYKNSLFVYGSQSAVSIEDLAEGIQDSRLMLEDSLLSFEYCTWWNYGDYVVGSGACGDGTEMESVVSQQFVRDYFHNDVGCTGSSFASNSSGPTNDWGVDPLFTSVTWSDNTNALDLRPAVGSPVLTSPVASYPADPFFTTVTYRGAFGPYDECSIDDLWIAHWTYLWEREYTPRYMCGDANNDEAVNLLDILYEIDNIYGNPHGPDPCPADAGDVNNDDATNLLDILYLISFIYGDPQGPAPICQ